MVSQVVAKQCTIPNKRTNLHTCKCTPVHDKFMITLIEQMLLSLQDAAVNMTALSE